MGEKNITTATVAAKVANVDKDTDTHARADVYIRIGFGIRTVTVMRS